MEFDQKIVIPRRWSLLTRFGECDYRTKPNGNIHNCFHTLLRFILDYRALFGYLYGLCLITCLITKFRSYKLVP